jgi:deazaflavin-dependent oxidoreductase (nitroreductase family)
MPSDEEFLAFNTGVIADFRAHGGAVEHPPFPVLLVTTTGARSGRRTTTPTAYGVDHGRVFVVASRGGAPRHPAWYHNVLAHPDVTVELGGGTHQARAVVVQGAERDRLYDLIRQRIPAFREYEQTTERVFPVVILDGVPAPQRRPGDDAPPPPGRDVRPAAAR